MPNRAPLLIAGTMAAVAVIVVALQQLRRALVTPPLRGEAIAESQGCLGSHGAGERGGAADPGARSGFNPGTRPPDTGLRRAKDYQ